MDGSRADRILEEWDAVARAAASPASSPRRAAVTNRLPGATLAGATLVLLAVLVGGWLVRTGSTDIGGRGPLGSTAPASAPVVAVTTPTAAPVATPMPVSTPTAVPTPTPVPTVGSCAPASLDARIVSWEGAAGHRIATVELTNRGAVPCMLPARARPQLVGGDGAVLIDGPAPPAGARVLTMAAAGRLQTLVQDGDYCGPSPVPPVTVAFVLDDGRKIVATPPSPTDATVPPCLSSAGSRGTIEMQPWAP